MITILCSELISTFCASYLLPWQTHHRTALGQTCPPQYLQACWTTYIAFSAMT